MPDCERYEELCSCALDGALTKNEKRELEAHLAECPACRAYMEDLRAMKSLWKGLETPAPEGLHEQIMEQIMAEQGANVVPLPEKKKHRPPVFTMLAALAACVMLAVTGGLNGVFSQGDPEAAADAAVYSRSADGAAPAAADPPADGGTAADSGLTLPEDAGSAQLAPADGTADTAQASAKSALPQTGTAEAAQSDPADAGQAPAVASVGPSGRAKTGEADAPALTSYALPVSVPDEIAEMPFARCFKVTGSGEMPFIEDMSLLLTADGVAYYALENNESKIAKAQEALRGAGFTVEINEAAPVSFQKDAGEVLFMATIS